jgi:hypothetical protein
MGVGFNRMKRHFLRRSSAATKYELERDPAGSPSPMEAVKFWMDQAGLRAK